LQESLASSVHDVQLILNYLAGRGDLDTSRVGMFGQGSGGTIAILASAADPRITALDVLTPWGDWPDWLQTSKLVPGAERANYLTPEFLALAAPLDPVKWLPQSKARSVRIQNVRHDGVVPDVCEERVESAAPEFAEIDQYGDSRAFYPYAVGGKIFDWLIAQLQPGAKPQEVADKSQQVHYFPAKAEPIH
jgi:acetyl esterase/lipase